MDAMNARLQTTQPAAFELNAEQALGQIAVELPGATAVFRRLKLDFCCGGQVSLALAAQAKGLDVAALLAELSALQRTDQPVLQSKPEALIEHIVSRYHQVHRQQLPELIRMATRVEAVHREHPLVPTGLAELLEAVEQDLLTHMHKEETILFPLLLAGGNAFVTQPIHMMRAEHIHHGAMLDRLAELSHNATPPAAACNTWRALYAGIAQLHDDLVQHIHTENNILFPQFEQAHPQKSHSPCCGSCGG
jgi:regulator of cell morphogenesis and NO signaling